ncbi:SPOR domain-containing protein [Tunicatimonas pelagia]|uniref:SPOR domain-containing protein n=1 Tax=Tunicatimonas pelagia TaxID=931531 RepID=UPI0026668559|nr:SPOR domain-containing protein [Tunicatimonas pelagia]WKN42484.1 SPOR domain-containing protein [Tunicatimonas pelagia]
MINRSLFLLLTLALLVAFFQQCAPTKTISTQGAEEYNEDLSQYRIQYADSIAQSNSNSPDPNPERVISAVSTLPTPNAITQEISEYFDEVDDLSRENNKYQGFTLQVYTGNSREEANEAKLKVYKALPDAEPAVRFQTIWRTRVGEYASRLEAQQDYIALRKVFPNVLLVPETFRTVD